ncbi:hypothetical protein TNCV_1289601 [Trichonephila clavipes]|nr:hypothetical protein TNCV_1289601 [Trichonephila clavipes]
MHEMAECTPILLKNFHTLKSSHKRSGDRGSHLITPLRPIQTCTSALRRHAIAENARLSPTETTPAERRLLQLNCFPPSNQDSAAQIKILHASPLNSNQPWYKIVCN